MSLWIIRKRGGIAYTPKINHTDFENEYIKVIKVSDDYKYIGKNRCKFCRR